MFPGGQESVHEEKVTDFTEFLPEDYDYADNKEVTNYPKNLLGEAEVNGETHDDTS